MRSLRYLFVRRIDLTSRALTSFVSDDFKSSYLYSSESALAFYFRVQQHRTVPITLYLILWRNLKNSFHITSVSSLVKSSPVSTPYSPLPTALLAAHIAATLFSNCILGVDYAYLPLRGRTLFSPVVEPTMSEAWSNLVGLFAACLKISYVNFTRKRVLAWAKRVRM